MSLIGDIEFLQRKLADISSYLERMDFLFTCNVVEEEESGAVSDSHRGKLNYGSIEIVEGFGNAF